jgi:hypothetical protein
VCLLTFVLQVSFLKCFEVLKTWQVMAAVADTGGQPPEYPNQEENEVNYDDEELKEAEEEEAQEGANLNEPRGGNQVPADRRNRQRNNNNNNRRNSRRPHPRRGDRRQGRERHAPYQRRRHHPRVVTPPRDLRQQLNNNRQGGPVPAPAGAPSGGASALLQAIQLLVGYSLGEGASSATGQLFAMCSVCW